MTRLHEASDWLFRDRTSGRIVIAQAPNAAMWVVLIALALRLVLPKGTAVTLAGDVLVAGLVVWALDEMARGVNPWRRLLGIATLAGTVFELLNR